MVVQPVVADVALLLAHVAADAVVQSLLLLHVLLLLSSLLLVLLLACKQRVELEDRLMTLWSDCQWRGLSLSSP